MKNTWTWEHHHRPRKEATASDVSQLPYAFGEACSWGSLLKRNLSVEGACTPHQEWVTTVVPETSEMEKWDFITDGEDLFGTLGKETSLPMEKIFLTLLERRLHHRWEARFGILGGADFISCNTRSTLVIWIISATHLWWCLHPWRLAESSSPYHAQDHHTSSVRARDQLHQRRSVLPENSSTVRHFGEYQ